MIVENNARESNAGGYIWTDPKWDYNLKTILLSLFIFLCFSAAGLSLATSYPNIFEGEARESIINFLSDPDINASDDKIVAFKAFLDYLDADEIRSMIVPKIDTLPELFAITEDLDECETLNIFYTGSRFGPLAKFLRTVEDILTSNHANEISSFLEGYKKETFELNISNPKSRIKQVVAELEVWNYMFFQLENHINDRVITSFKKRQESPFPSPNKNPRKSKGKKRSKYPSKQKKKDSWHTNSFIKKISLELIIEHLGIVHLTRLNEQFLDEDVRINFVKEDFWQQFWPELEAIIDLFPFKSSIRKGDFASVLKDAINFVFIASQLATQISPDLSVFASNSSEELDSWEDQKIIDFFANLSILEDERQHVQSKLTTIKHLAKCNN